MTNFIIVRHGQCQDNILKILNGRRDFQLTDIGKEQAKSVALKLIDKNIKVIYSSPLKRALQTANIIANELNIKEVNIENCLIEREFGILTGKPVTDIPKYASKILATDQVDYFIEAEGAESFTSLLERGKKIIEKISKQCPDQNVLLVTHGDIGKMIRAAFYGWDWEKGLKTPYLGNTDIIELK